MYGNKVAIDKDAINYSVNSSRFFETLKVEYYPVFTLTEPIFKSLNYFPNPNYVTKSFKGLVSNIPP